MAAQENLSEDNCEKDKLMSTEKGNECALYNYSKIRRIGILFTSLSLLFFALCSDFLIYPFFPNIAKKKGFSNTEIGVVYTAYNFARFLSSPITAWLVSSLLSGYFLNIFKTTEKWRWGSRQNHS